MLNSPITENDLMAIHGLIYKLWSEFSGVDVTAMKEDENPGTHFNFIVFFRIRCKNFAFGTP